MRPMGLLRDLDLFLRQAGSVSHPDLPLPFYLATTEEAVDAGPREVGHVHRPLRSQ